MEDLASLGKKSWFALKVASGAEASIVRQIKLNYEAANLSDLFEEVIAPSVKVKFGKKEKEKQLYPGYIFIKMVMNEKTRDAVISIPRVYTFLTDGTGKPKVIRDSEYQKMLGKITEAQNSSTTGKSFTVGDVVKIKSGSFNEFKGTVLSVDKEKNLLTLSILVFQRETRVIIAFEDAEKIN